MKFKKLTAIGAGVALALGSVFGVSLAASAVDGPLTSIGAEGSSYPANQWFVGDPAGPALTEDVDGLHIDGRNQLLYGQSSLPTNGAAFTAFVNGASFVGTGMMTFQIPVYFDGTAKGDFTTLRPVQAGSPSASGDWISSRAVVGLPANTPVPFSDVVAAFDLAPNAEILAFGVFVNPGDSAVLRSVTVGGSTWTFGVPVTAPDTGAGVPTPIKKAATFTG